MLSATDETSGWLLAMPTRLSTTETTSSKRAFFQGAISLIVVVIDKALLTSFDRLFQQLLSAERLHLEATVGEDTAAAKDSISFFLSSACCDHDNHGGFKRALLEYCDDILAKLRVRTHGINEDDD